MWSAAADAYRRSNHPGAVQEALQLQGGAVAILLRATTTERFTAAAAAAATHAAAECGKQLLVAVQVAELLLVPSPPFDCQSAASSARQSKQQLGLHLRSCLAAFLTEAATCVSGAGCLCVQEMSCRPANPPPAPPLRPLPRARTQQLMGAGVMRRRAAELRRLRSFASQQPGAWPPRVPDPGRSLLTALPHAASSLMPQLVWNC